MMLFSAARLFGGLALLMSVTSDSLRDRSKHAPAVIHMLYLGYTDGIL